MKRLPQVLLILVITLVVGVAGGLFLLGREVERRFDAVVSRWDAQDRLEVKKAEYTKSLFGAEAVSEVRLEGLPFSARFRHHILFPPLAQGGAIQIDTTLELPAEARQQFAVLFGEAPPLTATTAFQWDGSSMTEIASPPITTRAPLLGQVEWRGLQGTLRVDGGRIRSELLLPGMKTAGGLMALSMEALEFDLDATRTSDGLWLGETAFELARFEATDVQGKKMLLERIRTRESMKEDAAGLLRIGIAMDARRIAVDGVSVNDAGFELELSHLDRAVMGSMISRANGFAGSLTSERTIALAKGVKDEVPKLLKRSPMVTLKRAAFTLPVGGFMGNASAEFNGQGADGTDPVRLLQPRVKGHFEIGEPLLRWMMQQEMSEQARLIGNAGKEGSRLSEAEVEALATDLSDKRISQLERRGVLVNKEGTYALDVSYENDQFTLNGQTGNALGLWE